MFEEGCHRLCEKKLSQAIERVSRVIFSSRNRVLSITWFEELLIILGWTLVVKLWVSIQSRSMIMHVIARGVEFSSRATSSRAHGIHIISDKGSPVSSSRDTRATEVHLQGISKRWDQAENSLEIWLTFGWIRRLRSSRGRMMLSALSSSSSKGFSIAIDRESHEWVPSLIGECIILEYSRIKSYCIVPINSLRIDMMKCCQIEGAFTRGV